MKLLSEEDFLMTFSLVPTNHQPGSVFGGTITSWKHHSVPHRGPTQSPAGAEGRTASAPRQAEWADAFWVLEKAGKMLGNGILLGISGFLKR